MNERLRTAMLRHGVSPEDLAVECEVDSRTVERWIALGRVPHRRHRWVAAKHLGTDETYLWPDAAKRTNVRRAEASRSELIELYPDRASVPREVWLNLLNLAQDHIDVLFLSGTFYVQTQPRVAKMLAARVAAGAKVRLCLGDPASDAVAIRDREEGLGSTLGAKIRAALTYYRSLTDLDGCEIRLHATTLYNSLFRYDDEIIVNPHVYGEPASLNPSFHFRKIDGGTLFDHYTKSFETVWATAMPWLGAEV